MPGWTAVDGVIRARFTTGAWGATLMLANAIAYAAEAADHHPDLLLTYSSLEVSLSTHSAGGITEKDFALARRIDEIAGWSR
ncbi:MAG: 4a-hydroxytetrahydrobiopterin dehydratase [Acidobacteria bacterium]|nr:4a-hydroxytetrahydrobiopterin dehydratase [Acidobacteriota bacterium]